MALAIPRMFRTAHHDYQSGVFEQSPMKVLTIPGIET